VATALLMELALLPFLRSRTAVREPRGIPPAASGGVSAGSPSGDQSARGGSSTNLQLRDYRQASASAIRPTAPAADARRVVVGRVNSRASPWMIAVSALGGAW
jgi:hypothetical protein